MDTTIGDLIRTARHQAGLSQTALAAAAGVTQHCVSQWERGQRLPSPATILRLAAPLAQPQDVMLLALAASWLSRADASVG